LLKINELRPFQKSRTQFDSEGDAPYFGQWINKEDRRIVCYAEGDVYYTQFTDEENFDAEVASMCEQFDQTPEFTTISEKAITKVYQDRRKFFLDPEKCPASKIQFTDRNEDDGEPTS
jgi:hypothetical protein